MTNGFYKKKIKAAVDTLGIVCPKIEHFGRYCASEILDMEEFDRTIDRDIGNWAIDTFGEVYNSTLPLPSICGLAGRDTRRDFFWNPRTTFNGDASHHELIKMLFPWIESAEAKIPFGKSATTRAFLNFLKNLRWVILHDSAVLIAVYKRGKHIQTYEGSV